MGSESRLVDLCEQVVDCPHSTPRWTDSGETVLRSHNIRNGRLDLSNRSFTDEAHFRDRIRRAQPREGDLVITREAPMGEVAMIPAGLRCCLGQRMVLLRPDTTKVDPRYLLYALQSPPLQYEIGVHDGTGSTVSNLRIPLLENLPIPTPPISEQRRIASTLGALDDKIELNRRMSQTLESMARALFKSWFVDFDPVRANAEGRDPGLSRDIADLFPDGFDDSRLGEIPRGWIVSPMSELAAVVGGSTPRTDEAAFWENGRHWWATPKDLSGLSTPVLLSTERRISDAGLAQISSGLLPPGTVLLSSRAPIGYLAIAEAPVAINQGFIALRPRPGFSSLFLLYWAEWAKDEIVSRANGSTFLEISKSSFRPIPLVVPGPKTLRVFEDIVSALHYRVVASERESRLLRLLRDTLLPGMVTGVLGTQAGEHRT